MSQFTIYRSTDGSAPTLSGTAGDLVNLLDKCLVAGYGSKAAAGWTKPYTGTNKAAFKQGGGNQFYLRVQDDAPGAGGAKEARLRGYETMSDVDTGTGLFPTAAQATNGTFARKSTSADGTTRSWIVIADDRTVIVAVLTGDTSGVYYPFMFGDFYSFVTADGYRTMIVGRSTENSGSQSGDLLMQAGGLVAAGSTSNHWIARSYLGTGTSIAIQKVANTWAGNSSSNFSFGNSIIPFPNPPDGGIYLAPIYLADLVTAPVNHIRGKMRGFWQLMNSNAALADGDTFAGVGDLSGRTFLVVKDMSSGSVAAIIETSDTLDTN